MKILDGLELAGFIEERQLKQVRSLRQSWRVFPKLAIVQTIDSPVIDMYVRLKKTYGSDIGIDVEVHKVDQSLLAETIAELNNNDLIHGIIVQLPLSDMTNANEILATVAPQKDVDGLGPDAKFTPATAMAIDWLLAGYNVSLQGKTIAIVGNGRLVGAPLAKMWRDQGLELVVYDDKTLDLASELKNADLIVTATGVPGLITRNMVKPGAVIVDAGTAAEHGKIVGDLAADVRDLNDITATPIKGGVGPLTVSALFDNVISAARVIADAKGQQDL